MARFKLDDEQTDAILELRLYRLARLEILVIQEELKNKKKRSADIKKLLAEEGSKGIWGIVRGELEGLSAGFGKLGKRRTIIEAVGEERTFSEEELIVAEDNHVLLTRDGWVKRQREIKDPAATRLREGDGVLAVVAGSTKSTAVFFSSYGTAYTCRIADIPATTGYGEPIQKLFKMKDGESIVAMTSLDPRSSASSPVTRSTSPRRSPSRRAPTATASRSASRRSSSRAPGAAAGTRASPTARRSSASRSSPATRPSSRSRRSAARSSAPSPR